MTECACFTPVPRMEGLTVSAMVRVVVGVLVACVLLATTIITSGGSGSTDDATSSPRSEDIETSAEFAKKFKMVRFTNVLTGKGGMGFRQVAALLGKPKPDHITEETSPGVTVTTWTWPFSRNDEVTIYTIRFLNGRAASRSVG